MTAERFGWVLLNHIPQLGPVRLHRLLDEAGSTAGVLEMSVPALQVAGVSEDLARIWFQCFRDREVLKRAQSELDQEVRKEFRIVTEIDLDYPQVLRHIPGHPYVLYIRGRWPMTSNLAVAIVGTRRATPYGLRMSELITSDLMNARVATVSGLALGIDTQVHRTTLRHKGHTVAVLGHGLGHRYPRENNALFDEIASEGTLISEFPYTTGPDSSHFPRRNRIISGVSRAVVVVEAGERSGALITARYAAEQGRDVFVVPGPAHSLVSHGCHRLIKEGAQLIESAADILSCYPQSSSERTEKTTGESDFVDGKSSEHVVLNELEQKIVDQAQAQAISVDELSLRLDAPIDQLANALLSLELKGKIRTLPGQRYASND